MRKQFARTVKQVCGIALIICTVIACQDDEKELTPEQRKVQAETAAEDNSAILSASQEMMDITSDALLEKGISSGRTATNERKKGGHHNNCEPSISGSFNIDRSHKDSIIYTGTITIDYGNGETCEDSTQVRKGKIIDSFTYIISYNDSLTFTTTQQVTFEGFYKDSTTFDGTYISKSSSSGITTLDIENAKITYADGSSASWSGLITAVHDEGEDKWDWDDDTKTVTGSLSGTTRDGSIFTANISSGIVYDYSCFNKHKAIPVSGTIDITVGGALTVVDYGDGDCDKTYTITANGETTEYKLGHKNHS